MQESDLEEERNSSATEKNEDVMFAWGRSELGQLGLESASKESIISPQPVVSLSSKNISKISCGFNHSLFVTESGELYSCGSNEHGQLGHCKSGLRPEIVDGLTNHTVTQIAAGAAHSLALTTAGEVFSWGDNSKGQLGRGQVQLPEQQIKPKKINVSLNRCFVQITTGNDHCLALSDDGMVFSWGSNEHGQLGLGQSYSSQNIPTWIVSLCGIPVAKVVAGGYHSFIITVSTAVFGWGKNSFGQLGLNQDDAVIHYPVVCKSLKDQRIKHIVCGDDHTVALTMHGGVFTFGAGSHGQLGHDSTRNEILPKKVVELMGTTITQIASGRQHTLVYNKNSRKVYSFGLNNMGQLGLEKLEEKKTTPFPVTGEFQPLPNQDPAYVVNRIAAGGDHNFVKTYGAGAHQQAEDDREQDFSIVTLTEEGIDSICNLPNDIFPKECRYYISKVFSSVSGLNASFLALPQHFCCSSRNHGVDMKLVRQNFSKLAEAKNQEAIQLIIKTIENKLLPSMLSLPTNVHPEVLRVFLILPEYHLFEDPKYYKTLIVPFGECILKLDKASLKDLLSWWAKLDIPYFTRLVDIFKNATEYILCLCSSGNQMEVCLNVLKNLYHENENSGQKVSYTHFYIKDLKEKVNIHNFFFCNYPFVFDGEAKCQLLKADANSQMAAEVWRQGLTNFCLGLAENPVLILRVSRANLLQDTISQLAMIHNAHLKKPLMVVFHGEEAIDWGGVKKEFFLLLLKEFCDPKFGMLKFHEDSRLQWLSPMLPENKNLFNLFGKVCGLAIYNSVIVKLDFPMALYKKLLNRPVGLDDLKELLPYVGRGMDDLLHYDEDDFEDVFSLTFEIESGFAGGKEQELVKGGSTKPVTKENRQQYVDEYIDFVFNRSVKDSFMEFYEGFHAVCGGEILELFHPKELQSMVIGSDNYDFHELEKNTEYQGGYHRYHETIKLFWEVFHEMSLEHKKKFLLFLTGSDRIPISGMKEMKMFIQPLKLNFQSSNPSNDCQSSTASEEYLPIGHTCFNLLELPEYKDKDTMRDKLILAVEHTVEFGLL